MTRSLRLRGAVTAAALVLPLAGTAFVASPAQAANDPQPASEASSWLRSQLKNGLIQSFGYDDVGLSIDTWYLMQSAGDSAGMQTVSDAVRANASGYTAFGANATAKTLAFARSTGADPTSYDGQNDVSGTEAFVQSSGRLKDTGATDYASTIGQAYAARGLQGAPGQTKAAQVLSFLLTQQCTAGYFSNAFANSDASCNAKSGVADTDATAITVLQLAQMSQTGDVPGALARAKAWLESQQRSDGSFGGGPSTAAPNANSTGLAGAALAALGDVAAAQKAAVWVRSIQSEQAGLCADALAANRGAVAYDSASYADGSTKGLTNDTVVDQFHRATAQAGLVLKYAPAGGSLTTSKAFARSRSTTTLDLSGAAPGSTVCLTGPGTAKAVKADASGKVRTTVTAPRSGTGDFTFTTVGRQAAGSSVQVLGKAKLKVYVSHKRIKRGARQYLAVKGFAAGEPVRIKLYGTTVKRVANGSGKVTLSFKAGKRVRTVTVKVFGQFGGIRKGATTFKVVR